MTRYYVGGGLTSFKLTVYKQKGKPGWTYKVNHADGDGSLIKQSTNTFTTKHRALEYGIMALMELNARDLMSGEDLAKHSLDNPSP